MVVGMTRGNWAANTHPWQQSFDEKWVDIVLSDFINVHYGLLRELIAKIGQDYHDAPTYQWHLKEVAASLKASTSRFDYIINLK